MIAKQSADRRPIANLGSVYKAFWKKHAVGQAGIDLMDEGPN